MSNIEVETSAKVQTYKEKINELGSLVSEKNQQVRELQQRVSYFCLSVLFSLDFDN